MTIQEGKGSPRMPDVMEIDAFLADSIEAVNGKLYALGAAWNHLFTQVTPFRQARIGLGIAVHVPYTATNEPHRFEVRLEDADGRLLPVGDAPPGSDEPDGKLRRLGGQFTIGRPPLLTPGAEQMVALGMNFDSLIFEAPGGYCFVMSLEGEDVKRIGFTVTQIPQMPTQFPPMTSQGTGEKMLTRETLRRPVLEERPTEVP
jgi:hypothetical protein